MKRQYVILVRHVDSDKNTNSIFNSDIRIDEVTVTGNDELDQLRQSATTFRLRSGFRFSAVFHSGYVRSKKTAEVLAASLLTEMFEDISFQSIKSGPYSGLSESEVSTIHPEFKWALDLYRNGLLSSYDIPRPQGAESTYELERRTIQALTRHQKKLGNIIIVAHRSPITAILMHYARLFHGYPDKFFGYVQLDTGSVSIIEIESRNRGRIIQINSKFSELFQLLSTEI